MYHNEYQANAGGFSAYAVPVKGVSKPRKGFNIIKAMEYGFALMIVAMIAF